MLLNFLGIEWKLLVYVILLWERQENVSLVPIFLQHFSIVRGLPNFVLTSFDFGKAIWNTTSQLLQSFEILSLA